MYAPLLRRLATAALLTFVMPAHAVPVYGWVERVRVQLGDHTARVKAKLDSVACRLELRAPESSLAFTRAVWSPSCTRTRSTQP